MQFIKYGIVGIVSNLTGYVAYLLLTYLGTTPKITMSMLYAVGATIGYWGNRNLTFKHRGSLLGSGIRYIITYLMGYIINLTILITMVDQLGYTHQFVQAVAILIVAAFLFFALKFFVFSTAGGSQKEVR